MQLQAGNKYLTRDGRATSALEARTEDGVELFLGRVNGKGHSGIRIVWSPEGKYDVGKDNPLDLVELHEEQTARGDPPAIDYPDFFPSPEAEIEVETIGAGGDGDEDLPEFGEDGDEVVCRQEVLETAARYVSAIRESEYGTPQENFKRIADRWAAHLGVDVSPTDVAIMMMDVKLARLKTSPQKADNWIDIAGYAACGSEVSEAE